MTGRKRMARGQNSSRIIVDSYILSDDQAKNRMSIFKRADFTVTRDSGGILCASDLGNGIFTFARTKEELEANIRKAIECYFKVSYSAVKVVIDYSF